MTDINNAETNQNLWRRIVDYGVCSESDRRNQRRFILICVVWALSFAGANRALDSGSLPTAADWLVASAPVVLGIVAISLYLRMWREMDELMRRIQLEGLGLGFGAGVVFVTGYGLFELAGAPAWGNRPLAVMLFAWAAGSMLAIRRRSA